MNENTKKKIGKFISLILRHEPQKIGLKLDSNGWADVDELISKCARHRMSFTRKELQEIVDTNDKKRYTLSEDGKRIRANQGHSIEVDLNLQPVEPPEFLYHGTADRFLASINEEGIKKISRHHVHLSKDQQTASKVGARHGRTVILTILSGKMYRDGIEFYVSENGVWLTDYVDPKYILQ
ncbi:RNA 2'-phosphotransferase [Bacteroides sp. 224]|uniref:RNA 2'-phosphotransferase n=1 Tax=Bacteroides sp. 224 TaxID=2302936 RepID=UPI0013D2E13F|nr:RNA 2'-phosphotransferase [Bacteroides sp. 224]NDV67031.1 RNA 2'-phosphotransferase [Bacteroides sp. 224]